MAKKRNHIAVNLSLENYQLFVDNPLSPPLTIIQLNQVIHMHGFFKLKGHLRRKVELLKAVSEIEELMKPCRSTLNETQLPNSCYESGLSIDQMKVDLEALQWEEETPVQSIQLFSFNTSSNNNNDNNNNKCRDLDDDNGGAKLRKKRGRKAKERKVFDAVHLTKPRSRKSRPKRKYLDDIDVCNSVSLEIGFLPAVCLAWQELISGISSSRSA